VNCIARNAIYSRARYWQGDGFTAEGDVRNVAYINCESYDHADGGWDVKADNVVYVNCIGLRSKMNFRIWQQGFLYNCLSAYSFKRGGSWTTAGLWTIGDVRAARCSFHNNNLQQICADKKEGSGADPDREANVHLEHCIISFDGTDSQTERLYTGDTRITRLDSAQWHAASDSEQAHGSNPDFVAAAQAKSWHGLPPDAFDSGRYQTSKGYHSSVRTAWRQKSTDELVEAARRLLKHRGWNDFKQKAKTLTETP
jgi:hypothetical protein